MFDFSGPVTEGRKEGRCLQSKFEGLEVHTAFLMVVMGFGLCVTFFLANETASSVSIGIIIILIHKCSS